ncbi:MAG: hypothetical protein LBC98_09010 [Prevotellaceae bacterium]|jgi:hypothetical protein|nr:hypothetical protein [Prevotellaceae bacterium]
MMKKLSILLFFSLFVCTTVMQAQPKVAVFDPVGDLPETTKTLVREKIIGVIANKSNYRVVERSLIQKVLEENKFQSKGLVDEGQLIEMGRKAKADLICITVVVRMGDFSYVSCKLVNDNSQIEKQQTGQTLSSSLETMVQNLAVQIFSGSATSTSKNTQSKIAVFDPAVGGESYVSEEIKTVIREEISNVFVNNPKYMVLERANIDKVLDENKFQSSHSNDSEIGELGRMMGANYVCVISVVRAGVEYKIFCKQVDVAEGVAEGQGEGSTFLPQEIFVAAKEAALVFAANSSAMKKEIAKVKSENEKIREQRAEEIEKQQKAEEKADKKFVNKPKYNYVSVGIGNGITYGKYLGIGVVGRHGGAIAVGYEGGIGAGGAGDKTYLHYSGGVRIYPFKFIFVSAHYGIIGADVIKSADQDDGRWTMAGNKLLKGTSFMGGVSLKFTSSCLTLSGGLSYPNFDFGQKSRIAWNVAYGVAF